jgi:hypothetical protein
MTEPSKFPPAIALVPGFFGFDHRGESTYFADRFVAGLRSVLEARGASGVPVLSVSTLGIASLQKRQLDLLSELQALETPTDGAPRLGGPRTWHLQSPLAQFATGHPSFGAVRDMALATVDVARRGDLGSRIRFAMSASPRATKMPFFLLQMMLMNDLARDLRPDVLGPLSARPIRRSAEGRVSSVATVAPRPDAHHSDKLFRDLWRWTHQGGLTSSWPPPSAASLFDDLALRLPSQRGKVLPPVDAGDNDGVVTTQSQIVGELIGVVVGDHVDVLGRYRRSSLVDEQVIDPGLLTSGAEFGDDEFFGLLLRVGDRIADMVRS